MSVRRRRGGEGGGGGGHDGGGMLRWLLTYSDMITLLMVFFIVLYAVSQVDKARYEVLMKALKQVLTGQQVVTQVGGTVPVPPPVVGKTPTTAKATANAAKEQQMLQNLAKELQQAASQAHMQSDVSVTVAAVGVRVSFLNGILFNSGEATIKTSSYPLLDQISAILGTEPNNVIIEGYTDDVPINTQEFHSNWDLSAIRATRVIEYLIAEGLDPSRFSAEAYSEYRPIASNETPTGRQDNRRVDMVILRSTPYSTEQIMENYDQIPGTPIRAGPTGRTQQSSGR